MAENVNIFLPSRAPLTMAVLVLPHASILEVASVLDPMRAANRHLGQEAFRWRVVSPDGRPVPLTCGIELPSAGPLASAEGADVLMVIVGYRQAEVATPPFLQALRRMAPRFRLIAGVDAGAWVMARAGLLDGYRATVHWEDLEDFAATFPQMECLPDRYVIDRNRVTVGGAAPAQDLMLHLIGARHGAPLARQVAASFLTTQRAGQEPQVAPPARDLRLDGRVAQAIARMEARIDDPEPMARIARAVGLSPRRMESLFHQYLGESPGAYAMGLRLQAARRMVTDTRHPLAEVALRTGFSSPSTLSRAFSRRFGMAPSALRRGQGLANAVFISPKV
ncbi:GlxA family transcriptional regulator [Fuscovulum ytuae]|uniref:GlxA family transcriptional regulator n=1 Tax=Fuscovulum ytuae TaxID=3042299 RepID=A0ABY8Q1C4_9RHOB|nr:GlxA family transcriptional regulator [Fuscovulum sp. YMD61]WGV14528.1 GlxA family transcriptional regulator [Fuscovulum sp. YMD61]